MEVVKSLKPKEEEMIIIKKYQEMMLYNYHLILFFIARVNALFTFI